MKDIEILKDILVPDAQVPLQQRQGRPPSVELTDKCTTVEIKGLPHDSIVIRAEAFNPPNVFKGLRGERKRADFVIVSNEERGKWLICIEIQASDPKTAAHVEAQLKGAQCFMSYCKCIGKSFWELEEFLDGYQYRFISMADVNSNKETKKTSPYSPHIRSKGKLHDTPDVFLKILRSPSIYFRKLLYEVF